MSTRDDLAAVLARLEALEKDRELREARIEAGEARIRELEREREAQGAAPVLATIASIDETLKRIAPQGGPHDPETRRQQMAAAEAVAAARNLENPPQLWAFRLGLSDLPKPPDWSTSPPFPDWGPGSPAYSGIGWAQLCPDGKWRVGSIVSERCDRRTMVAVAEAALSSTSVGASSRDAIIAQETGAPMPANAVLDANRFAADFKRYVFEKRKIFWPSVRKQFLATIAGKPLEEVIGRCRASGGGAWQLIDGAEPPDEFFGPDGRDGHGAVAA